MIRNTFPNINQEILEAIKIIITAENLFNYCPYIWQRFADGILHVVFFPILGFKGSVKEHSVAKIFLAIWGLILYENSFNFISYKLMYKLAFIHFFFLYEPKTRTISLRNWWSSDKKYFCFFHSKSRSFSKLCRIQ